MLIAQDVCIKLGTSGLTVKDLSVKSICVEIVLRNMHSSKIHYIKDLLNEDIEELRNESKKEGYNLIERLINDFISGKNKFNRLGEVLIVYEVGGKIIGVCGLNVDPANLERGRIRRLYVLPQYRNKGIGRKLVRELINYSTKNFKSVSVNIGDLKISKFYEELGFKKHNKEEGITHLLTRE